MRLTDGNAIDTTPLTARQQQDRLQLRPRRLATALRHECERVARQAHQLWLGQIGTPVWCRAATDRFHQDRRGSFYIGVMRPDGSGERLLTEDFLVEGRPGGRTGGFDVFSRGRPAGASASSRLYTIDLTGSNQREVNTRAMLRTRWSPCSLGPQFRENSVLTYTIHR
jgi:hypothetical protein